MNENRELIEGIFQQLAQGNSRALGTAMAEDCRWVFPGSWSWSGVWEPRSAVLDGLLRPLMAQFADGYRNEADFVVADGDRVVVQARGYATTVSGEPYHQTYCFVFRIRDGQIVEIIEHCDTALVERVLEPLR
ncbi:nuclear transport factor 2 family protein [Nocardia jejuensis]|uniref:nuclear transport factor 2 family protein n=1 Tax=Nocardia jejuensis TaxID=328049 RepID=UPI00082A5FC1|nr:nuclear transport factor 2 family protein [Nocardia jejuensis]